MNNEEILKDITKATHCKMERQKLAISESWANVMLQTEPVAMQNYILLQILNALDTLNGNMIDVETAVQRLDPLHRD